MTNIKIGEVTINSEDDAGKHMSEIEKKYRYEIYNCTTLFVHSEKEKKEEDSLVAVLKYDEYKNRALLIRVRKIYNEDDDIEVKNYDREKTFWRRWKLEKQ